MRSRTALIPGKKHRDLQSHLLSGIVSPLRLVHSGILTYFAPMRRNQENICPMAKIKQTGKPAQAAAGQP